MSIPFDTGKTQTLNLSNLTQNISTTGNVTGTSINGVGMSVGVGGIATQGSILTQGSLMFSDGSTQTTAATIPRTDTFSFKQYDDDDRAYTVGEGNPGDTDPNNIGGLIDNILTCFVTTVGGNYEGVSLDFSVVGEWVVSEENKGVVIARAKHNGSTYVYDKILRASYPGNSNVRFISPFTISFFQNQDTTLECCNGKYIDTDITANTLYSYTVLLVNSSASTSFKLNKVVNGGTQASAERGVSSITAQLFT